MERARPAGLIGAGEGRRFAWTLAGGFAVLAAGGAWRGHSATAVLFGAVAAIALLAGLVAPRRLGPARRGWMVFGEALSKITSPIFFGAVYFVVLTPMGVLRRTFGHSPLARSGNAASYWHRRDARSPEEARQSLERLF